MRQLAVCLFLLAVFAGISYCQETLTFPLAKSPLDTSKAIRVLESYVDLDSKPKELIKGIPNNLSDVFYVTFQVSRANDSLLTAIRGTNPDGQVMYYFDSNNNEDFLDESPYRISDQPMRVPFSYDDNVNDTHFSRLSNLIVTEIKKHQPEYHLDELWEASLSVRGESLNVGIQRFLPDLAFLFLDSRQAGTYDKPFFIHREVLGLGGKFYRVQVDFSREEVHLLETEQQPVDAGFPAPDFHTSLWKSHAEVTLSSLKGRIVLLRFWHPACSGSRAEAPSYDSLSRTFNTTSEVVFLAVTTDSLLLSQYLTDHSDSYSHIVDSKLWNLYGVTAPFVTFLIDRNGLIARRQFGYSVEIKSQLQQMLSRK